MKSLIWTVGFILLLTPIATEAGEGQAGNGGGTICIGDNECITLAEAGLKIVGHHEDFYFLSYELRREVERILREAKLPPYTLTRLFRRVMGKTSTFLPVETIDPKLLRKIKKKYRSTIEKIDAGFNLDGFQVNAWSGPLHDARTYLLPSFFSLSLERQAYLLIHEANVRGLWSNSLREALILDGFLHELVTNPGQWESPAFDRVSFVKVLKKLDLTPFELTVAGALLKSVQIKNGGVPLALDQLCDKPMVDFDTTYRRCLPSYEKLLELYGLDPRIAIYFQDRPLMIGGYRGTVFGIWRSHIAELGYWKRPEDQDESFRYSKLEDEGQTFSRYEEFCAEQSIFEEFWDLRNFYLVQDLALPSFLKEQGWKQRKPRLADVWLLHCGHDEEGHAIPDMIYLVNERFYEAVPPMMRNEAVRR